MKMRIWLTVLLCLLVLWPVSVAARPEIEIDMTIDEYLFSSEDVGQIVIKISGVPGNPLARDYTITNEIIVYEKLKKDEWVLLAGSRLFNGPKKVRLLNGEEREVFDFLGLDAYRSLVSRKTVRAVRKYELTDEMMRVYLQGYMSTAAAKNQNGIRFVTVP
jgi:hypothetical protein